MVLKNYSNKIDLISRRWEEPECLQQYNSKTNKMAIRFRFKSRTQFPVTNPQFYSNNTMILSLLKISIKMW